MVHGSSRGFGQVTPKRIQRKRTKGWRMPPNTVYVGRPSRWGNPFTVEEYGAKMAVSLFSFCVAIRDNDGCEFLDGLEELRGKDLACWCPLDQPCHADVLLEAANK